MPSCRSRRPLQFSLGTLLLAVTGLSIWLGVQTKAARLQRAIAADIRRLGGQVYYDWQLDDEDRETGRTEPPGPVWLRRWIGDDYFQTAVTAYLMYVPCRDGDFPAIENMPALQTVSLEGTEIGDATLPRLARLRRLRFLNLSETKITDKGAAELNRLSCLTTLWICPSDAPTDESVSDAGLKQLRGLRELKSLALGGSGITDASIAVLAEFKHLRELYLLDTAITADGWVRLRNSLPDCEVMNGFDEWR
ncbi:MAG TPA: hypothetical protein VJ783_00185 [Pirellulales bacterium]|nr:hypothetical protein [Pirellulales bacterium]